MESAHTDQLYFIAEKKTYLIKDDILYIVSHDGIKYMRREMCFMAIQEAINKNSGEVYLTANRDSSIKVEVKPLSLGDLYLYEDGRLTRRLWLSGERRREIESDIVVLWYGTGEYSFTRVCRPSGVSIPGKNKDEITNQIIELYFLGMIPFHHSITGINTALLCTSDAIYLSNTTVLENKPTFKWDDLHMKCELVREYRVAKYKASATSLSTDVSTRDKQKREIEEMLVTLLKVDTEMFLSKEEVQSYLGCGDEYSFTVFLSIDDCVMDKNP